MTPTSWRLPIVGVASAALLNVLGACSGDSASPDAVHHTPSLGTRSGAVSPPSTDVVHTAFDHEGAAHLPWLAESVTGMPRSIPDPNVPLPSLLDHLPGRAVLVLAPRISTLGVPVQSWSELRLEFLGVDGHWTRLSLDDLGLDDSLTFTDTYGAGDLSADGRWWAGSTRSGIVALNLATGAIRTFAGRSLGTWIAGQHAMLSDHEVITIPQGVVTHAPYSSGQVGYEPSGVPLSWHRARDGQTRLVEWHGATFVTRATVQGVVPPRAHQFTAAQATRNQVATTESRNTHTWVTVVDSQTGQTRAVLNHATGSELSYRAWLNPRIFVIAQSPYFLAWMPSTGHLYRVSDARSLSGHYWDINFAAPLTIP